MLTLSVLIVAANTAREVRWWMKSTGLDNNLALINKHPDAVTGIYTYVGAGVGDDGKFSCGNDEAWLAAHLAPYRARNLTVTPALGLTDAAVTSGLAEANVAEVAAFAERINVTGLMLDYEPQTSVASLARAYASYVRAFSHAMQAVGLQAEMCTSDWGILDGHTVPEGYGLYASTGVDRMMSMAGTYFGTNLSKNRYNFDLERAQGVTLDQLAVGVGTMIADGCATGPGKWNYNWTEAKLRDFVSYVQKADTRALDIWRADIDNEGDCTEPYYFDVAAAFLAGRPVNGTIEA